jgi:hypothetical protein
MAKKIKTEFNVYRIYMAYSMKKGGYQKRMILAKKVSMEDAIKVAANAGAVMIGVGEVRGTKGMLEKDTIKIV